MTARKSPKCKRCAELERQLAQVTARVHWLDEKLAPVTAVIKQLIEKQDELIEERNALAKQVEEFEQERNEREWRERLQAAYARRAAASTVGGAS